MEILSSEQNALQARERSDGDDDGDDSDSNDDDDDDDSNATRAKASIRHPQLTALRLSGQSSEAICRNAARSSMTYARICGAVNRLSYTSIA